MTTPHLWKCVIDLGTVVEGAQAYVMLSRVKELQQIFILNGVPENKIYPIQKALDEMKRLEDVSINNNPETWDKQSDPEITKICFLNAKSLMNKFDNIRSETWIPDNIDENYYELKNYKAHVNNDGIGKGIAVYHKQEFQHICDFNEEHINITKMESNNIDVITVYRSKEGSLKELMNNIKVIMTVFVYP